MNKIHRDTLGTTFTDILPHFVWRKMSVKKRFTLEEITVSWLMRPMRSVFIQGSVGTIRMKLPQDAINPAHGSLPRVNSSSHDIFSHTVGEGHVKESHQQENQRFLPADRLSFTMTFSTLVWEKVIVKRS